MTIEYIYPKVVLRRCATNAHVRVRTHKRVSSRYEYLLVCGHVRCVNVRVPACAK